ncbi:TonB-dependent receptor [Noviherbaspirillum pedocola]|uniref:TonB-dependent receptor n=1 Tax=Noviherbaspirillum pedocola TaxID=2801341 RepID=A0A934STG4_9BURK|nr:TonB-dependent receptor [Noviherbaspirillum pedocola]MBK4735199.1 TonB-dependent receptor [Noviherbaspirillum pedocola]
MSQPIARAHRRHALRAALASAFACFGTAQAQTVNPAEALELPTVEVIGTTLLPGLGTPIQDVPANVQIITSDKLERQHHNSVAEHLETNANSVTVNAAQGNPYQPDVNFRGFTASPLLGVPQGLSVFQDGVRINEPFGDTVNWDLLPQSAIASMQLIPGSNPAYGLNTLGGALAVYTKSGSAYPGGSVQLSGGSFGRKAVEFEKGGKSGNLDYFLTGNFADDHGWADHNPSRIQQFFGKVGYQTADTDFDVSLTAADNRLQGTQALPASFSDNIRQAYTYPDRNDNKLMFLSAKGSHFLNDQVLLGGNVYYRHYRNNSFASNVNDHADDGGPQAFNDASSIDQDSAGLGLQLTLLGDIAGRKNQFVIGGSADLGNARYTQNSQPAAFTADRGTEALGDFASITNARTGSRYYGLFATNTLSLTPQWALTLSGRYNVAKIHIRDRSGEAPELNGDHSFSRFSPAVGVNWNPSKALTAYATYNEGMRAPTAIELTCADPTAPCKLPNSFLSDPPLNKVIARTIELGARGKGNDGFAWSAAIYRTELDDDIAFVSSGGVSSNAGYFQNVGKTRRQGLELSAGRKFGPLGITAHYSFIDATYQTSFAESSPSNSSADTNGEIQVNSGNRIPGIPQHSFKLRLDYDITPQWEAGANIVAVSGIHARGDENNADSRGKLPGYAVINLDTRYTVKKGWDVFARVSNLFNRQYANFGVLGQNVFTGPGRSFDPDNPLAEQFRGYGVPRAVWVGTRYSWM